MKVSIDARSASLSRTTGWERTVRELIKLGTSQEKFSIELLKSNRNSKLSWAIYDYCQLYNLTMDTSLIHFPSIPPSVRRLPKDLRVMHTISDLTWWKYPETSSRFGKSIYKNRVEKYIGHFERIITVSNSSRSEIADSFNFPSESIDVIYPGVEYFGEKENFEKPVRPYLLFVGTIEPRKNLKLLLSAWNMSQISKYADLKIVGRIGWKENLGNSVQILDSQTDQNLHELFTNCSAIVLPSLYEGFGLPVVEGMLYGKQIICSDIPSLRESTGNLGLYFDNKSVLSLKRKLEDIELNLSPIKQNIEWAKRFTWEKYRLQHATAYKKALGLEL